MGLLRLQISGSIDFFFYLSLSLPPEMLCQHWLLFVHACSVCVAVVVFQVWSMFWRGGSELLIETPFETCGSRVHFGSEDILRRVERELLGRDLFPFRLSLAWAGTLSWIGSTGKSRGEALYYCDPDPVSHLVPVA